jgi:THO complex subunit 2
MSSLPSSREIKDAAAGDADKCQEVVLQAVTYGTEAHESLKERTQEACKDLADAWEDCVALEDTLVDVLWLRGSILASDAESPSFQALVEIIKILVQIPGRNSFWTKLQGNLMPSIVDASGLASEQELLKRLKMNNTQVHYKQQKYNLLQEESEGYSKVLHFLISGDPNDEVERRSYLRKLLGTFELDPNRVLDLTIDIMEAQLYPDGYSDDLPSKKPQKSPRITWLLAMMKEFSLEKLPMLIGFKLAGDKGPSPGLLRTIAFLAAEGLLDLDTMMLSYFAPIENEVEEAHKVLWMKEKRRIQALSRISLSGAPKEDPKQAELAERLGKCLEPLEESQLLKLLLVLLGWGEWGRVKPLLSTTVWGQLCSLLPDKFGFALCDVAKEMLEPWYRDKVGTPGLSKPWHTNGDVSMSDDVTLDLVVESISDPLLCTVQAGCIASRPVLFCQLCRVFRSLLADQDTESTISDETYSFFKKFLVPSLSLFPSNPAISTELWAVLKQLPYATRYRFYEDWRGPGLERAALSSSPSGKPLPNVESEMAAGKATRYALKRLSKDNIRDMSRQLAKVTHSNPLVVYATILNQIESYDNMVEVMVEAQRFANPLGLDVLGYCILGRLSGTTGGVNRSRLKGMNTNYPQGKKHSASFIVPKPRSAVS